ncbi:MAG: hypothetical protein A2355_16030 [Spirochaetes bacterium RIFOXYB1_FULL_32_8]|nr:MAG: hypothetical protein A2355_16030 [Spirochaetes bacterium RIFOXYB1_FULL_32_8]
MKMNDLNKGFSLMETLIWVGIVGIFVGLVGVSGVTFMNKAKVRGATQEMKIYSMALLDYYQTEGDYPSADRGLKVLLDEQYVTKTDFKDPWKTAYEYVISEDGLGFTLTSFGADKKPGGTGLHKDIIVSSNNDSDSLSE